MSACCNPHEYDAVFTSKYARKTAKELQTSGLDDTARRMVDFLDAQGLENAELSTAYDGEAVRLLNEAGLTERVTRRIVDLAAGPEAVPQADVVVLHRVVCCYPD